MDRLTTREAMDRAGNTICETNLMTKECDTTERKGLTESPCDEASRYTDGDLRLAAKEIAHEIRRADANVEYGEEFEEKTFIAEAKRIAKAFRIASALIDAAIKERYAKRKARRPTSTPSV